MKIYVLILLLILTVVFIFQNYEVVKINFLFWNIKVNRALLLLVTYAIGITSGLIFSFFIHKKKKEGKQ
ncbi:MAG: LapA family protein [Spirochaetes bacterium]|nr:LapA family protein [Spirochaetota bacterium]